MNDSNTGASRGAGAPGLDVSGATVVPLRTWPALLLVGLMVIARYAPLSLEGGMSRYWMIALFGPLLGCLLIVIWWLTASRATWKERVLGVLGLGASIGLTLALMHGSMGIPGTTYLMLPVGMIAFAIATAVLARRAPKPRTGCSLLFALAAFAFSILLRNEGMTGDYILSLRWRWSQTPEDLLLASRPSGPATRLPAADVGKPELAMVNPEWPGFRGADRASRVRGPQISTNWSARPPRQLWKVQVGPAWSSFAVAGHRLFTQEQRGPKETVVCYHTEDGHELWSQQIEARFDEPLGGPGPRATPTLAGGALFTTGATGMFLRLNPTNGEVVWQADLKKMAGRDAPMWGFAASPLVVGGVAVVYTGGPADKGLLGLDVATGALRWSAACGNDSYSSAQLTTVAGESLVLMLSNDGLLFVDPASGAVRLNYEWKFANYRALQPQFVSEDTVLLPTGMNMGTRAIRITKSNGQLAAQELWTSRNLKPDFSDFVTHEGYAYGVDVGIFTCVNLKTGERQWKGGRYGKGQVLLLESSGLLLMAAESGEVVLLRAEPREHIELCSFKALEGKTWNHPVLVADRLYLRNSQEAACFQLPLAEVSEPAAPAVAR